MGIFEVLFWIVAFYVACAVACFIWFALLLMGSRIRPGYFLGESLSLA